MSRMKYRSAAKKTFFVFAGILMSVCKLQNCLTMKEFKKKCFKVEKKKLCWVIWTSNIICPFKSNILQRQEVKRSRLTNYQNLLLLSNQVKLPN